MTPNEAAIRLQILHDALDGTIGDSLSSLEREALELAIQVLWSLAPAS